MKKQIFTDIFVELIRRASTDLPADVEKALKAAAETESGVSRQTLEVILSNIAMARKSSNPLCQDTGLQTWSVRYPRAWSSGDVAGCILEAARRATERGYLRPNAVSPLTNRNSGDNTGPGHPIVELLPGQQKHLTADLLLKGGGSENVSAQVSLPDASIGAGRDLDGVRRAALKMIHAGQGRGCAPGIIGLCIGGDRVTGYKTAKAQLGRPLKDRNRNPVLAKLESRILEEANALGIGPMGFGGRTTVLGVKIGVAARHPACYFVTMAYGCWALRRWSVKVDGEGRKPRFSSKPFKEKDRP
jgi:fumarate hydratase class I